jgi:erythromycin esterase-like protein
MEDRMAINGSRASWNLRDTHMFDILNALLAHHGPDIWFDQTAAVSPFDTTELGLPDTYPFGL